MKRLLLFALLALAPVLAFATTTWTTTHDGTTSQSVTTTGTEAAPTLSTQGLDLTDATGFSVHVESVPNGDGGTLNFSAGTLLAYLRNPVSLKWDRARELDCKVAAGDTAACYGYAVAPRPGLRVAYVPSGLGTAVNIYVNATEGQPATATVPRSTELRDGDGRTVVATGTIVGQCLGADLTTTSADGPTIPAGAEYRFCAMTDLWISWGGGTAAADAPSEPVFARTCVVRGPFSAQTIPTAILPAGATALSGKELVACPVTRPQ